MPPKKAKSQKFGWADAMLMSSLIAFGGYCFYRMAHVEEDYRQQPSEAAQRAKLSTAEEKAPVIREKQQEPAYRTVKAKVTAYCPGACCCGPNAHGKTSTGKDIKDGDFYTGVAVDPRAIPYRTKIEIPGIGVKEADDTGGAMRQDWEKQIYHIDVRMPSHEEARKWGVKELDVKIYPKK